MPFIYEAHAYPSTSVAKGISNWFHHQETGLPQHANAGQ